jgi:hypothetical protein
LLILYGQQENIAWMQATEGRVVTGTTIDLMYKKIELLIEAGADVNQKGAPIRILKTGVKS